MVVEEKTNRLFPSDVFVQPGEQAPVTSENLAGEMLEAYRLYATESSRTRTRSEPSSGGSGTCVRTLAASPANS